MLTIRGPAILQLSVIKSEQGVKVRKVDSKNGLPFNLCSSVS